MKYSALFFQRQGQIAIITINRPDRLNSINAELCEELVSAIEICREDEGIRAVVLTGAGSAFSSGGDLKTAREMVGTSAQSYFFRDTTKTFHRLICDLRLLPKPVIASINGSLGGGGFSLALACDLRIAADNIKLKQSYTGIGLSPDGAFTLFAGALAGLGKTSELLFLDPVLSAEQALEMGLINKVVSIENLNVATLEWAEKLASGATRAFAVSKALLNKALLSNLESQLEMERQGIIESSLSNDFIEGITAFFEKRPPKFLGK
jgi:2-(1,2-epoxy-1,2-dihydrophenyl)acetyl-CoA isomerase